MTDTPKLQRLIALDVFRGATIAMMILVNNPGSWGHIYAPLRHAPWHGWTPTDLVFPFFLFIVGVAIPLALQPALQRLIDAGAAPGPLLRKIIKRSLVLFGLGIFLALYPLVNNFHDLAWKDISRLRIPGVLQRIAVCYGVISILFLYSRTRVQVIVCWGALLLYWALMTWVPVPGYGAGMIDGKDTHLAAWLDRMVFGEHVWVAAKTWDPEGLLSTLPATATTLFGVFTGRLLLGAASLEEKVRTLLVRGVLLVILGFVWDWVFPINKSIWTSSFVVLTAGQAMCALALCLWFVDGCGYHRLARPFVIYGKNAITVFVGSGLCAKTMSAIRWQDAEGATITMKGWVYRSFYSGWIEDPRLASLAFALTWVVAWFAILWWMDRKNWVLKV